VRQKSDDSSPLIIRKNPDSRVTLFSEEIIF
jgi:hypothetical protein